MDGIYGVCFPGFAIHAIEWDRPFLSETGYRSFLGYGGILDLSVEQYVRDAIAHYFNGELKGKLKPIAQRYRDLHNQPDPEPDEEDPTP